MTREAGRQELISIVVPAYNAEPFIAETLASVINQSYRNLEIVVVDDGSTDATAAIVRRLAEQDPRITLLSVANGGVARARNIGIARATGDYVAFVDADDLWHPDKLRLQFDRLQACGPDFAGCYALYRSIDTNSRIISNGPTLIAEGFIYARHLAVHFVGNGSSLLVRRSAALAIGGYDPSYADQGIGGCEDLDFELRLAARYKICGVAQYLVGYRRYAGNMSSNVLRMSRSMKETIRRQLAASPDLPRQARRYAIGSVIDYTAWVMLRDFRVGRALMALARLSLLDGRKSFFICKALATRIAERLRLLPRDGAMTKNVVMFGDVSPVPQEDGQEEWVIARMAELATIDARLCEQRRG